MAVIHGYKGEFRIQDTAGSWRVITPDLAEITVTTDQPVADVTGFGSVAKSFVQGQYSWTVDVRGWFNSLASTGSDTVLGPLSISGSAILATVYPEGSVTGNTNYSGSVYCTGYTRSTGLGGGVSVTAKFQGSSTLTRGTCA